MAPDGSFETDYEDFDSDGNSINKIKTKRNTKSKQKKSTHIAAAKSKPTRSGEPEAEPAIETRLSMCENKKTKKQTATKNEEVVKISKAQLEDLLLLKKKVEKMEEANERLYGILCIQPPSKHATRMGE